MAWQHRSNRVVPRDWDKRRRAVLNRDARTCHVCGHGEADQVDHLLNVARGGTHDLDNLGAIHGDVCPTCGRRCHKDKTAEESRAAQPRRQRPVEKHPGRL